MRLVLVALLLPLAGCSLFDRAPQATAPAAVMVADAAAVPGAVPAARLAPTSPPNSTVEVADKVEPKKVCWTETVTGTRGRKQTVCRTERTERDAAIMRKDFQDFQTRGSSTQPQVPGP